MQAFAAHEPFHGASGNVAVVAVAVDLGPHFPASVAAVVGIEDRRQVCGQFFVTN